LVKAEAGRRRLEANIESYKSQVTSIEANTRKGKKKKKARASRGEGAAEEAV